MKIAIVNDLRMAVESLRRVVAKTSRHEVCWVAYDGADAVRQCATLRPDLILMDLIMPVMDGVEATRRIMRTTPCAILVVTASVGGNASKVYEAMSHGALDAAKTPMLHQAGAEQTVTDLIAKIDAIGQLLGPAVAPAPRIPSGPTDRVQLDAALPPVLALGASTGGPQAIARILSELRPDLPLATVLIQHISPEFAPGLATWLNRITGREIALVQERATLAVGGVYLAAAGQHIVLAASGQLAGTAEPRALIYRPSVDVFLHSIARLPSGRATGVLLTGMGRDGAEGLMAMRKRGHHTVAQDKASCVVYGMPRAAAELGAAAQILPLETIASHLNHRFSNRAHVS
jgi:chemotaxis response regulator CheB